MFEGACHFKANAQTLITLAAGGFMLLPAGLSFSTTSFDPPPLKAPDTVPIEVAKGRYRPGHLAGPADVVMLIGHCEFGSPDTALLMSLLPKLVHVHGQNRLATLAKLVREASRAQRPARDVVLARLMVVLLIESKPFAPPRTTTPRQGWFKARRVEWQSKRKRLARGVLANQ